MLVRFINALHSNSSFIFKGDCSVVAGSNIEDTEYVIENALPYKDYTIKLIVQNSNGFNSTPTEEVNVRTNEDSK